MTRDRTTKPERRAVRASNPTVCRAMGVGAAVRLQRQRSMRPEAEQLDRLARALGQKPLMSESRYSVQDIINERNQALAEEMVAFSADVAQVLTEKMLRPALAEAGVDPSRYAVEYTIIDEPNPDDVPYPTVESVTVEPDGWLNLKYAPHISLGPRLDAVQAAADKAAPDFREWWCAPVAEQPPAIGTEHLQKVVGEFQRNVLPDLIARPDDDNEES